MTQTVLSAREEVSDKSLVRSFSYVGGKWIAARDNAVLQVTDPASGAVVGEVASLTAEDSAGAVDAGQRGCQMGPQLGHVGPGGEQHIGAAGEQIGGQIGV